MPAFYAHERFGKKVWQQTEGDLKEIIRSHYPQFRIGLQGPDIFFFYRLYTNNKVSKYGTDMHAVSAYPFFLRALEIVRRKGRETKEYAYLLGFLCHYILDSESHSYVDEMIRKTGVEHVEIEEEFEKKLLRIDNKDPLAYPIAKLVPTDWNTVEAIAPFHPAVDKKQIRNSLFYLKGLKHLFTAPGAVKQTAINSVLKLTGKYASLKGIMNQRIDNQKCFESNIGLLRRFDNAVSVAVQMIQSFDESVKMGKELDERFERTFE